MNNKKLSKILKKATVAAIMGITAVTPLLATAQNANAATYTDSEYFPGESEDTGDAPYEDYTGSYFRNFKNRSANIYVKDKAVKKVFQTAAKAWKPVFKFKFVKSAKKANFNSSKYANVVVKKDGGVQYNEATIGNLILFAGSMKNLKKMHKDFPDTRKWPWYTQHYNGKITNYKKWKAYRKKALAKDPKTMDLANWLISTRAHTYAPKAGLWIPSKAERKKHDANRYITVAAGTRSLTKTQQVGNATEILGEIIGIGQDANPVHEKDEVDIPNEASAYYNFKVTQSDLDHVNWIYAHPWSGSNYFWDCVE